MTYVLRTPRDPGQMLQAARQAIWSVDPLLAFYDAGAVSEMIRTSVRPRVFVLRLVLGFAAMGVLVAIAGAYGAMAWSLQRRTPEFGVRLALGARGADLRRTMFGYALRLAALGVLIGLAGAIAMSRLLRTFLFGIEATDPLTLSTGALAIVGALLLAAASPARRAGRIDPASALRS
jgi:putative ABC transport system permease protein